jgi:S-adenosylmethionine-diacylglycerol 3-amino-3-carboxypropyl transferase
MLKFIAPDPTFFNYVKGDVTKYLYNKLANHLQSETAQKNHILHFALFGYFGNALPHYVQAQNYETIQNRIGRIKMFHGSVEEIFKLGHKFDGFNLSNIFEYTKPDEFKEFAGKLLAGGEKNAKYVYWNLMLPRKISDIIPQKTISELDSSQSENFDDKGLIYFRMCVDKNFSYEFQPQILSKIPAN